MLSLSQLSVFILGTFVIVVIPGPNILYLIARSVNQGRMAGFASVLGIEAATIVHIFAASLGLSSLLLSSALAFNVVKYLGAAYLVYLGICKLFAGDDGDKEDVIMHGSMKHIFYQGFLVNLLNPKTSMFFFAFLPQFVVTGNGNVTFQILSLGLLLVVMAVFIELAYVLLSSRLSTWLKGNQKFVRRQRSFAGWAYIGLGLSTALSGPGRK